MGRFRFTLLFLTLAAVATCVVAAPASADGGACDRVAAPGGSDVASGTTAHPFATAQRLADSLAPGETGCLRAGTYQGATTISRGGVAGAAVTLRSWPGERVTLIGRLVVAKTASFVTVEQLWLDGRNPANLPSPTVNGDDVTFRANDVTNHHTGICFVLGASNVNSSASYGRATRAQIVGNRIHDCGQLPATNHDHGVYVEGTDDARIVENWIYDNADRGIQLYPDAQDTEIAGNVLDGNGTNIIFSGDLGLAANGTTVSGNLITRAATRYNVESWYPDGNPKGVGNDLTGNCLHGAARADAGVAGTNADDGGFRASANLTADPGYLDRVRHDYRIPASSPCAAIFSGDRAAVPGPAGSGSGQLGPDPAPAAPSPDPAASLPVGPSPSVLPGQASGSRSDMAAPGASPGKVSPAGAATGRSASAVRLWLAPTAAKRMVAKPGDRLRLGGRVQRSRGAPSTPVLVQAQIRGRWRTVVRARTSYAGTFDARWRIGLARGSRSLRLRALVEGHASSNVLALSLTR